MVDDGGDAAEHPFPELVRTTLDLADLGIGPTTAIVIATQGHYDDLALQAALATEAGYVGVIAAEKRASSLLQSLRDEGVDETQLARVHAPAGLDLGAIENAEIAVAVLADLVARRAAGQLRGGAVALTRPEAVDPVCGMTVFVDSAKYHTSTDGTDYYFCAAGCQRAFLQPTEQRYCRMRCGASVTHVGWVSLASAAFAQVVGDAEGGEREHRRREQRDRAGESHEDERVRARHNDGERAGAPRVRVVGSQRGDTARAGGGHESGRGIGRNRPKRESRPAGRVPSPSARLVARGDAPT